MLYVLGGIALLALLGWTVSWLASARPEAVRKAVLRVGIGLAAALGLFLLVTGRGGQILTFSVLLVPLAIRWWRRRQGAAGFDAGGGSQAGRVSRVATGSLVMELDHDTGRMSGTVVAGPFQGRDLAGLGLADLLTLWTDLRRRDGASVPLLETWLDRTHGATWRDAAERLGGEGERSTTTSGPMTRTEAFAILGLAEDAGPEAIVAAHKRLMRHVHPDMGGSSWLAARINEARDVLQDG